MPEPIKSVRRPDTDRVGISWHLGDTCQFACSYCPEVLHAGKHRWPSLDHMKTFLRRVHGYYVKGLGKKRISLTLTGGEPTLCPHLTEAMQYAKSLGNFSCGMVSNGGRTIRFWGKTVPYIDYCIISYHIENTDYDHFMQVVQRLDKRLERVHLNMVPDRWDDCYATYMKIKEQGIPIFIKPLLKNSASDLYDYTADQLGTLRKDSTSALTTFVTRDEERRERVSELILNKETRYLGWHCMAGLESLNVTVDGNVWRAECKVGKLGNINDPDSIIFPKTAVVCPNNFCTCITDLTISKRRASK